MKRQAFDVWRNPYGWGCEITFQRGKTVCNVTIQAKTAVGAIRKAVWRYLFSRTSDVKMYDND